MALVLALFMTMKLCSTRPVWPWSALCRGVASQLSSVPPVCELKALVGGVKWTMARMAMAHVRGFSGVTTIVA